jgi:hypothetical protein
MITPPYEDLLTKELVISLVRTIHHPETDQFLGSIGVDFLLAEIQQYIEPAYDLERELVVFGDSTGRVLLDSDWFKNDSDASAINYNITYEHLQNPSFTEAEWAEVNATESGQHKDIEMANSYFCYVFRFRKPLDELLFIAITTESTMFAVSSHADQPLLTHAEPITWA